MKVTFTACVSSSALTVFDGEEGEAAANRMPFAAIYLAFLLIAVTSPINNSCSEKKSTKSLLIKSATNSFQGPVMEDTQDLPADAKCLRISIPGRPV